MPDTYLPARELHRQGRLEEAWALYQQAAASCHRDGAYWFWLAMLALQIGREPLARDCLVQAQRWNPPLLPLWQELGPPYEPIALELIFVLPQPQALAWLDTLLPVMSDEPRTLVWERLLQLGWRTSAALEALLGRSEFSGSWPQGWHLLAMHQMREGRNDSARGIWRWLRERYPDFAPAALHLGHLALQQGRLDQALEYYQQALRAQPQQPELHYHLGRLALSGLEPETARRHFDAALQQSGQLLQAHPLWNVQREMAYAPLLPETQSSEQLLDDLLLKAQGLRQKIPLAACSADLLRGGIEPCFDLNYLSEADAPVRAAFSDIFILPESPRWCEPSGALRLGVMITPGHEGLFLAGSQILIQELAQSGVSIEILGLPASAGAFTELTRTAGIRFRALPVDVAAAVALVQSLELDLVYHWECGTDPLNYFLPLYQLGRVQFTSWGSVSSTGHERMQYFLSAAALEQPDSQAHYRERLKLMPVLPILYSPNLLLDSGRSRVALGLPEGLLIGCPHNPQKLTAHFLTALRELLEQVPEARLLLLESRYPAWQRVLDTRVRLALGEHADRLIWQSRLSSDDFGALLRACDLLLDPFSFGSGKLAFDALGRGLPLLTMPGQRLRGRITAACYQQINYTPLIADSPGAYIQLAVQLLRDPAQLIQHGHELSQRRDLLIRHPQVMPSLLAALSEMSARPVKR